MRPEQPFEAIAETLRLSSATLRDARVPFALGGSFAAWARGGPRPQNDLDLMIKPEDADRALEALEAVGMRAERPIEEWLYKAWNGNVMIDLIFSPAGLPMTDDVFARADTIPVLAVDTPVMALEDVLATKLMALDEHPLDYSSLLGIVRAVREQIDWHGLHARVHGSPYAEAFFTLVQELGIAQEQRPGRDATARVRVIPQLR